MRNDYVVKGSTVRIFLPRRNGDPFITRVCIEDLTLLRSMDVSWHVSQMRSLLYAAVVAPIGWPIKTIAMHRFIVSAPSSLVVDHIDGDGLNNCRWNLRCVSNCYNILHRHRMNKNSKSGFRGVYYSKSRDAWVGQVRIYGKAHYLGLFSDPVDASNCVQDYLAQHPEWAQWQTKADAKAKDKVE